MNGWVQGRTNDIFRLSTRNRTNVRSLNLIEWEFMQIKFLFAIYGCRVVLMHTQTPKEQNYLNCARDETRHTINGHDVQNKARNYSV